MYRSLRVAFALLAAAFAVSALSVDTLSSGTTKASFLTPQLVQTNGHTLSYYQVWVPENASTVVVDFTVSDTPDCGYLNIYLRSNGLPCPVEFGASEFACNSDSYNPGNGVAGSNSYTFNAYTSNVKWQTGTYMYIGIGRYYAADYTKACAFTLKATVTSCPAGQTATATGSAATDVVCVDTSTITAAATFQTSADYYMVRRFLPFNTGMVNISVVASSNNLYLYGRSGSGAADTSSSYECYTSTGTSVGQGGYYYNMMCITPIYDQYFYLLIEQGTTATPIAGGVDIVPMVCSNSTGGYNCLYQSGPLATAPTTFSLSENNFPTAPGGEFRFFFLDVAPNTINGNVSFIVSATVETGSGYVYWRRNGFVDESSDTNDGSDYYESLETTAPTQLILTQQDLYPGGRFYFAVEAYTGNVSVSLTPVTVTTGSTTGSPQTTTGSGTGVSTTATGVSTASGTTVSTTGSNTSPVSTTGDGSSASVATVSFVAVAAAVVAAML